MELRPILSAMLRNKTGAILVGLQIALTLAVVANAVFIIMQRIEKIGRPNGMDSANLIFVHSYGYGAQYNHLDTVRRDLDTLRAMPGVKAAAVTSSIPLSGSGGSSTYGPIPDHDKASAEAAYYDVDEAAVEAFGLRLVEGRSFTRDEVQYSPTQTSAFVPSVIISRKYATALFGDAPALGRTVYDGLGQGAVVVGIVETMMGAWVSWAEVEQSILQPRISPGPGVRYVVRGEPGRRDALIAEIEKTLSAADISRAIVSVRPHDYYTERSYRADNRMVRFLTILIVLMVAVTALGIVGLASFHVNVRTKQIGTRRAVGARRFDIVRYFMLENLLLTTGGALAGTLIAFAFGQWLSATYSLPPLHPGYVAGGVVLLWILGQLAVFVPARRAAAISPAVATRTV